MRKRIDGKWGRCSWMHDYHGFPFFIKMIDRDRLRHRAIKLFYGNFHGWVQKAHPEWLREEEE